MGLHCHLLEHQSALRQATADGPGWLPGAGFDLGLHVRWGDACSAPGSDTVKRRCQELTEQPRAGGRTRKTDQPSLRPVLDKLDGRGLRARTTYLATDSELIASQPAALAAQASTAPALAPLGSVHQQPFSRDKYDPRTDAALAASATVASRFGGSSSGKKSAAFHWLEQFAATNATKRDAIFDETMLDLLLLSRAKLIAGQMMGNMPRLALQLRVSWPPPGHAPRALPSAQAGSRPNRSAAAALGALEWPHACTYVSLDSRAWCVSTFCRANLVKR